MSDFLPVEIDAESIRISNAANGWGVTIQTAEYGELYIWMDMPDALYDQLHEEGILEVQDGEVVKNDE